MRKCCCFGQTTMHCGRRLHPNSTCLLQLARTGREEAARALFRQLSPLIGLLFAEPNPAPVKAALALCGLATAEVRRPLMPASKTLAAQLDAAMALLPPATVARAA